MIGKEEGGAVVGTADDVDFGENEVRVAVFTAWYNHATDKYGIVGGKLRGQLLVDRAVLF